MVQQSDLKIGYDRKRFKMIRKVFFLMQQKPTQKPTPAWEIEVV